MKRACSVAVIISAYNCADYIIEALESFEKQTTSPDEVVVVFVVDDGSTDRSVERLLSFSTESELKIILVRQA